MKLLTGSVVFAVLSISGIAQVAAPGSSGVRMGHLDLSSKDPDAQRKLWVEVLGAEPKKFGEIEVFKLPGVLIVLRKSDRDGGTEGSVVNHIGLKVRDLKATLAKVDAAEIKIVSQSAAQAMLLGPDGIRVELSEDRAMEQPVANHHIHFYTRQVDEMKKWYVATFGAVPGKRGKFEAADLPGVNLSFTSFDGALSGTKGRVLDHIGFEVRDLEAFSKKLEAAGVKFDVPYRKVPALGISIAFLTDPWGTYIELTEGLDKL